mmetsp:Transcript_62816/g.138203  ORF Transcript_62816/g.138203 Transcript_62816/m.138203 type:complete len:336 (-) Transcript_62816:30-1037(-)
MFAAEFFNPGRCGLGDFVEVFSNVTASQLHEAVAVVATEIILKVVLNFPSRYANCLNRECGVLCLLLDGEKDLVAAPNARVQADRWVVDDKNSLGHCTPQDLGKWALLDTATQLALDVCILINAQSAYPDDRRRKKRAITIAQNLSPRRLALLQLLLRHGVRVITLEHRCGEELEAENEHEVRKLLRPCVGHKHLGLLMVPAVDQNRIAHPGTLRLGRRDRFHDIVQIHLRFVRHLLQVVELPTTEAIWFAFKFLGCLLVHTHPEIYYLHCRLVSLLRASKDLSAQIKELLHSKTPTPWFLWLRHACGLRRCIRRWNGSTTTHPPKTSKRTLQAE